MMLFAIIATLAALFAIFVAVPALSYFLFKQTRVLRNLEIRLELLEARDSQPRPEPKVETEATGTELPELAKLRQATAPQATAPQATAPQVTAPQATAPQVTAPQATAPQVTPPQAMPPQAMPPRTKTAAKRADHQPASNSAFAVDPPPIILAPTKPEIFDIVSDGESSAARRFEDIIGGKLPIWIGGIALVFAGFFLVRFSIEAGLFGPLARCISAALFGLTLIALAEYGKNLPRFGNIFSDDLRVSQSIAGAGIAILYATLYMASELYGLLGLGSALGGMVMITILAFFLSQKQGPPTALMGLFGGFLAPYVAGLGADSIGLLLAYLGIFTLSLFGLAIYRGWAWLALLATGGSAIWTIVLLVDDTVRDLPLVGGFIALLAIGGVLTLARTGQEITVFNKRLSTPLIRIVPLAIGICQMALLAPLIEFAPLAWVYFAILAGFAIALAWRDEELTFAVAAALIFCFVIMALALSDHGRDNIDILPAIGFATLFAIAGHIFAARKKSGTIWAAIAIAAPVGMLALCALLADFGWSDRQWSIACLIVAANSALLAWRTRSYLPAHILPWASMAAALFAAIACWLLTADEWLPIITIAAAMALAAWARFCNHPIIARQAIAAAALSGAFIASFAEDLIITLAQSLAGETNLYQHLPAIAPMIGQLLIPSLAMVAGARLFRKTIEDIPATLIAAAGLIGVLAFAYLLFKQVLMIGPITTFVQYGFAERLLLTNVIAACGWLLLRRSWSANISSMLRRCGWALAGLALFRFVYFDLLLLSPTHVKQLVGPAPLANLATLHYTLLAIWLWQYAAIAQSTETVTKFGRTLTIASLLTAIAAVMVTIRQAVHGSDIATPSIIASETYLYSAGLLLLAIAWLARGIQTGNALLRIAGLLLLTLVTFKVFLIDAAQLTGILRILSFLGLGIALLGIGRIYGKVMGRQQEMN